MEKSTQLAPPHTMDLHRSAQGERFEWVGGSCRFFAQPYSSSLFLMACHIIEVDFQNIITDNKYYK
jgi:hypothetical protein